MGKAGFALRHRLAAMRIGAWHEEGIDPRLAHCGAQRFHPASAANPPDKKFPDDPGDAPGWNNHPTHYFRHIENVRAVMEEALAASRRALEARARREPPS